MTITIRIESPLLKRLLIRRRIEKLPAFPVAGSRWTSPVAVWATTIVLLCSALSLMMAASIDLPVSAGLKQVGSALYDQVRRDTRTEASFISPVAEAEPFPLGAPPTQSMDSPRMRPSVAVGSLDDTPARPRMECVVGESTVPCR